MRHERWLAGMMVFAALSLAVAASAIIFALADWDIGRGDDIFMIIIAAIWAGLSGAFLAYWFAHHLLRSWQLASSWLLVFAFLAMLPATMSGVAFALQPADEYALALSISGVTYAATLLLVRLQIRAKGWF